MLVMKVRRTALRQKMAANYLSLIELYGMKFLRLLLNTLASMLFFLIFLYFLRQEITIRWIIAAFLFGLLFSFYFKDPPKKEV